MAERYNKPPLLEPKWTDSFLSPAPQSPWRSHQMGGIDLLHLTIPDKGRQLPSLINLHHRLKLPLHEHLTVDVTIVRKDETERNEEGGGFGKNWFCSYTPLLTSPYYLK